VTSTPERTSAHQASSRPAEGVGRGGALLAYRFELAKLRAQRQVWALGVLCLVGPFVFAVALTLQTDVPSDTLFGRWVLTSGFATPLVVLGFATGWALPLVTGLVAGDIFSSEDRYGTWTTVLTRSRSRTQLFAGKVLAATTWSLLAVALLALSSTAAGVLVVGTQPLESLSGTLLPPERAVVAVLLAWVGVIPPVLALAAVAVLLSVATRSSLVGVGGPVVLALGMQLGSFLGGAGVLRDVLLLNAVTAWHGLLVTPTFVGPLVRGSLVSACWVLVCLVLSHELLTRRDVAGG
jgi:ABC-2 type transport system permease protein